MVRHEAEENRAYASGFYHTHVYEGTQKLEDLLAAYSVRTPYGGYHHGNPDLGTPSDHRQLAEYRNRRNRHHAGSGRFYQYAGRRLETQPTGSCQTSSFNGRPNDNIGLTIFAGESFTQCPLTVDHGVLLNLFNSIKGDIAQRGLIEDGTAIGMGIANAVTRLKDSKAKSKVIILLTDGSNNRGDISPLTAAEIAKQFGIRIYTIGVGTNGTAPYPMQTYAGTQYVNVPVEIDEKTLTEIAGTTNGNYFRATSNSKLKEVYQEIDKLEKTKLNVKEFSKREEEYQVFAWIAFFCILLELLLRNSVLKKIP